MKSKVTGSVRVSRQDVEAVRVYNNPSELDKGCLSFQRLQSHSTLCAVSTWFTSGCTVLTVGLFHSSTVWKCVHMYV